MDITAAFLTLAPKGISPRQILQGIASGLIGPTSFRGGWATSALGLALHFLIAFTAAAVFYVASRKIPALLDRPWLAGVGYALVVYGFMYWIVIPLDHLRSKPVTLSGTVVAIVTHIICVGLPISLVIHRFVRR
jgi:energy-converting hydrogenase Eha subunit G